MTTLRDRDRELKARIVALERKIVHDLTPNNLEAADSIAGATEPRIRRVLENRDYWSFQVLEIGAFSYLLEALRILPEETAVNLAAAYLDRNSEIVAALNGQFEIDRKALRHFAKIIVSNHYDWPSFAAAFCDPEEAKRQRLLKNRNLTPEQRDKRHQVLVHDINTHRSG